MSRAGPWVKLPKSYKIWKSTFPDRVVGKTFGERAKRIICSTPKVSGKDPGGLCMRYENMLKSRILFEELLDSMKYYEGELNSENFSRDVQGILGTWDSSSAAWKERRKW